MLHIRRAGLKPPRSSATPAEAGFLCAESICLIQKIANLVLDTGFSKRLPCTGVTHGLIRLASDCNRWRNIVLHPAVSASLTGKVARGILHLIH